MDVPQYQILDISIHALLAESDYDTSSLMLCQAKFLSTLSLRRATPMDVPQYQILDISIHALLAESDVRCFSPAGCWRISIHALLAESDIIATVGPLMYN